MPVIINELEHTAASEAPQDTRGASDNASGGAATSPAVTEAQILAAIRREAARAARLWAD